MKNVKVCFYPTCENATNHFLANLARLLKEQGGFECAGFLDLAKQKKGEEFKQDVYHFNWFDQSLSFFSFVYRLYILLRVHFAGKRIVWTVHNSVPHGSVPAYNKILQFLLLRFSSVIHIMSEGSRNLPFLKKFSDKIVLIPHGDYFGSYPDSTLDVRTKYSIPKDAPMVLFVGAIRPYKNIEILLKAFDFSNAWLLICGGVRPLKYLDELKSCMNRRENVIFSPEFVPDSELSAYLRSASFLVAPYSYESALNSGSVLLSCSYGKTMVVPDIAGVQDIEKESGCLYAYHYTDEKSHVKELRTAISKALDDCKNGTIATKESLALNYMRRNTWLAHSSKWCALYSP